MTVDVKGNSPLWLKVKDLAEGMTYRFRIRAKTFTYGPEIEANVTTGPGEGRGASAGLGPAALHTRHSAPHAGRGVQTPGRARWGPWQSFRARGQQTQADTLHLESTAWACAVALMEVREEVAGLSGHP